MSRNFIIILVIIIAALVGVFIALGGKNETGSGGQALVNPREIQENDHLSGAGKVELIEYGDFECPGCAAIYPVIKQLKTEFADDVKFVFRNFPLITIHPNAMAAHRAAEAASLQGKFWEMHDLLYENQSRWSSQVASQPQAIALFEDFAGDLGLDIEKYKLDVGSGAVFDLIDSHIQSGNELGFTGTPSLLLNGEELATPRSYEDLKATVQGLIDSENGKTDKASEDAKANDPKAKETN